MSLGRALTISAALAAVLCGCDGGSGAHRVSATPPRPVDAPDLIYPLCSHSPVNWDGEPGPDGISVVVLFFRRDQDLPVTVRGALEFALYDGVVQAAEIARVAPLRVWRFQGTQLSASLTRTAYGWGYSHRLGWGSSPPKTASATLLVKYVPPDGPVMSADPLVVPIGPR